MLFQFYARQQSLIYVVLQPVIDKIVHNVKYYATVW